MASKFYAGMKNVVEVLNQMWDAFAAGPYNALPLTGGNLSGPVTSSSAISAVVVASGNMTRPSHTFISGVPSVTPAGSDNEVARFAVAGASGFAFDGCFSWLTNSANGTLYKEGYLIKLRAFDTGSGVFTNDLITFSGRGEVTATGLVRGPVCQFGPVARSGPESVIAGVNQSQGQPNVRIPNSALFYVSAGSTGSAAACALSIASDTTTGRSINAGGTVNASGADYAEYLIKALLCGTIAPGQIVGIDADGRLTDKWNRAIAFMVKSTSPCMVGGDSWAQDLGARPVAPARVLPSIEQEMVSPAVPADPTSGTDAVAAVFRSIVTASGDTDAEWAAKEEAHASALAAFDVALEQRRQTVDRIAFAGQVPVNVLGAAPGQYIVPVRDGEGIVGQAVDRGDMTLDQYMSAIGRVIAIEEDGRARIIVKVA
ncbi:hypothetical protein [Janthinobacterium sp.]|uniref:hypothetical protein n=1 Tax=Janthinobacterium sp. TaxID=1871054 RepID=UPI0028A0B396|nr:hypothetical protein [Janthinobacterium sp.]